MQLLSTLAVVTLHTYMYIRNGYLFVHVYGGREGSFYCNLPSLKMESRNGTTTAMEGRNGISRFN